MRMNPPREDSFVVWRDRLRDGRLFLIQESTSLESVDEIEAADIHVTDEEVYYFIIYAVWPEFRVCGLLPSTAYHSRW